MWRQEKGTSKRDARRTFNDESKDNRLRSVTTSLFKHFHTVHVLPLILESLFNPTAEVDVCGIYRCIIDAEASPRPGSGFDLHRVRTLTIKQQQPPFQVEKQQMIGPCVSASPIFGDPVTDRRRPLCTVSNAGESEPVHNKQARFLVVCSSDWTGIQRTFPDAPAYLCDGTYAGWNTTYPVTHDRVVLVILSNEWSSNHHAVIRKTIRALSRYPHVLSVDSFVPPDCRWQTYLATFGKSTVLTPAVTFSAPPFPLAVMAPTSGLMTPPQLA